MRVSWTQIIGVVFPIVVTAGTAVFLRVTKIGTAMRALANDREITAMLGVPVRRVEAAAWFGSGLVCGMAGLLLSNLVGLDIVGLTFLVIPALAAALIGQLRSLWVTLAAGFVIGLVQSCLTAVQRAVAEYRTMTPFVLAIVALLWFARRRQVLVQDVADGRRRRPLDADEAVAGHGGAAARARSRRHPVAAGRRRRAARRSSLFALPALLDSYWLQIMTAVVDLQHRHARARAADRPGRHGVAVPVRAAGGRRVGGAAARATPRRSRSRSWSCSPASSPA